MSIAILSRTSRPWPRVAYGALFMAVLPALLALWARRLDTLLALPGYGSPIVGAALAAAGLGLMLLAVRALWVHGHGLPMSPFPPQQLVTRGAYRLVAHPIYTGAALTSAGAAIAVHSPAGLWIVTPVLALSAAAFVIGYERDATLERFGSLPRPLLRLPVFRVGSLWRLTCCGAEWVANSWGEKTVGPVRFLSHGLYAAVGALVGTFIAVVLAGAGYLWWMVAMTLAAQVGAALWAQLVEGSPQLLRPYGYFGSVVGVIVVALVAGAVGADGWLIAGAFATGACFTQVLGRVRCLVQGCCHGRPVNADWGLRYVHPRSRVVRLSKLEGVPLHPTQLYSIVTSLLTAAVLLWLWFLGAPLPLITGSYFILTGLGRFVEEHYRGEPQTPWLAGLRLYQWLAIGLIVGGAAVTAIAGASAPRPAPDLASLPVLIAVGVLTYIAYGIDFPNSSRRFSRLI